MFLYTCTTILATLRWKRNITRTKNWILEKPLHVVFTESLRNKWSCNDVKLHCTLMFFSLFLYDLYDALYVFERIFCFSFKQCVQCICNAIDKHDAAVSEEFYDNLVTCDIKSVDCLIGALLVEQSAVQRLKGDIIYQTLYCLADMETNVSYRRGSKN